MKSRRIFVQKLPVPANQDTPTEVLIAESVLPYMMGDSKKTLYLSYRVCGFSVREAIKLADITQRSVMRWRKADPNFKEMDGPKLPEIRKQLGADFTHMEFLRNVRLLLKKDFDVLMKFVQGLDLSKLEQKYLGQMRKFYTPQQLEVLKRVLSGGIAPPSITFTQLVISLAKQKQNGQIPEETVEAEFRETDG